MTDLVKQVSSARLPTAYGEFTAFVYESLLDGIQHFVLVKGEVKGKERVLVRVHSECLTGDVFGSMRCDCGSQLDIAMKNIAEEGQGVLIYLRGQEGRGIGLGYKLHAYELQDQGYDTVEANLKLGFPIDTRKYHIAAQILCDLGLSTIRLMTNNPMKYAELVDYGLSIVERIPLLTLLTDENRRYILTKKEKMGHFF
jgi:3,4-dihydroxy 2-butanone 4-phosphate synthase/GTP cyclohydrolase II